MRNLPDFIVEPSGRVHDIRHLKRQQNQQSSTQQNVEDQYTEYLNKIEKDNELYKKITDDFNKITLQQNVILIPIGIIIAIIVITLRALLR